jgi:hypothetical protein
LNDRFAINEQSGWDNGQWARIQKHRWWEAGVNQNKTMKRRIIRFVSILLHFNGGSRDLIKPVGTAKVQLEWLQ